MEKLNDKQIRLFLQKITKNENEYYEMITRIALTFGLRFSQISEIMGMEEEKVGPTLRKALFAKAAADKRPFLVTALDNLQTYTFKDPQRTRQEFNDYINDLYAAYVAKDKDKILALRGYISDITAARFRKNYQLGMPISDEEALAIIRYQIKYFLSPVAVSKFFRFTNQEYVMCLEKAKLQDPNIALDYTQILKMYQIKENDKSLDSGNVEAAQKIKIDVASAEELPPESNKIGYRW